MLITQRRPSSSSLASVASYLLVFLYHADTSGVTSKGKTVVPGWDDLIFCSELSSLDSLKELSLSEDHQAQFYDKQSHRLLVIRSSLEEVFSDPQRRHGRLHSSLP